MFFCALFWNLQFTSEWMWRSFYFLDYSLYILFCIVYYIWYIYPAIRSGSAFPSQLEGPVFARFWVMGCTSVANQIQIMTCSVSYETISSGSCLDLPVTTIEMLYPYGIRHALFFLHKVNIRFDLLDKSIMMASRMCSWRKAFSHSEQNKCQQRRRRDCG